ncbi:DNA-binding transcriptional MerR regulator [Aequitasia blattaphilus]|uniref:MerR family transcriptional regulator n=1 Tax=Aequitasia blattaphilus TaxID=2949332 RepID=A0ABT1E7S4_9FIRM|nr:MerR family transcriptional regulator [Aequitasia blattaphilus]MCP1101838.1 MerR family transcriptional regulator [Aequitasia blattaphilus]MCR8614478.1 MerR family transcriptional regulator [Aequitasia blattaphilus]
MIGEDIVCKREEEVRYRIGTFAGMNHVTIKTLRYYDEIGLLEPAYVETESGYRYYTSAQLPILHQILALRDMGLALEEIKKILKEQGEISIESILKRKRAEILKEIARKTEILSRIDTLLNGERDVLRYTVVIKSLPEVIVASMRQVIDSYNDLFEVAPQMGVEMEKLGCECLEPSYCFNLYHDGGYKAENVDVEICESVTEKKEDTDQIKFKLIPHVESAACVLHQGPYDELPKAYAAAIKFVEENGYEMIGPPRESFIDGVWNKDCVEDWLTEIQIPIKKLTL